MRKECARKQKQKRKEDREDLIWGSAQNKKDMKRFQKL